VALKAQIYPVQADFISGNGTFAGSLYDIAGGGAGNFQVQLRFNDIFSEPRDIYLMVGLKGGSINTMSRPNVYNHYNLVHEIDGGETIILSGSEFGEYLETDYQQNLGHINFKSILNEGTYQLTVEVYDYLTHRKISNTALCIFRISHGIAPVINSPACGREVSGDNLLVTWVPAVDYSGAVIKYEMQVVELLPGETNVQTAFSMAEAADDNYFYNSSVYFSENQFNFTLSSYEFQDGYTYGFRVRAHVYNGIDEVNVLANNGYSDVCWFMYMGIVEEPDCPKLATVTGPEAASTNSTNVRWTLEDEYTGTGLPKFKVAYRPYTEGTTKGFYSALVSGYSHSIDGLIPNTDYELYVKPYCSDATPDSIIVYFRTEQVEQVFQCGMEPVRDPLILGNRLDQLYVGDVIYLNNVPIVMKENLTATNGMFKGPANLTFVAEFFQEFTPGISVEMKDVVVDTKYRMVGGLVKTEYSSDWAGVIDADVLTQGGSLQAELLSGELIEDIPINGTIGSVNNIQYDNASNTISVSYTESGVGLVAEVYDANGSHDNVVVIRDSQNTYYAVNTETEEVTCMGIKPPDMTAILSSFDDEEIDPDHMVTFTNAPGDPWAFDPAGDTYFNCGHYGSEYTTIRLGTTVNSYRVPWKFVPTGSAGKVALTFTEGDPDYAKFSFVTSNGIVLLPDTSGYTPRLTLPAGEAGSDYHLYALYNGEDGTTQVGRLHVRSEKTDEYPVTIVVVGDVTIPDETTVKAELDAIFAPYAVEWDVKVETAPLTDASWDLDGDGRIDSGDEFLSEYSQEQIILHTLYKEKYESEIGRSVVFLFNTLPDGGEINEYARSGDMPINRKWGYLFGGIDYHTLAHELGHGKLTLRHTFASETCGGDPGITQNLMDYGEGIELNRFQWEAIHNSALIGKPFQDDDDGALKLIKDEWVLRKYIEQFRWAQINKIGMECNGISLVKCENVVLSDGVTYPSLEFQMLSLGKYNIYPWYDDLTGYSDIEYNNGLAGIRFVHDGNQILIRTDEGYINGLIDYLYCSEETFGTQINSYGSLLNLTETDFIKIIDILQEDALELFNATSNYYWLLTLAKNNSEDYNPTIMDRFLSNEEKKTFIDKLKSNDCNVITIDNYLNNFKSIEIDGETRDLEVEFLLKASAIYKEIYPPTVPDVFKPVNYTYGSAYIRKVFKWEETLGSDIVYNSTLSRRNCYYSVSSVSDWLTIFNNTSNYLFNMKPFDYAGIDASNYAEQLPATIDTDNLIAIPGFLLHYILENEYSEQYIENLVAAADMGITLATLGAYAEGKTVIKLTSQYATGVIIDLSLQLFFATLDGTSMEDAFESIVWREALYSGAEIIIPGWLTSSTIVCIRSFIGEMMEDEYNIYSPLGNCIGTFIINYLSHQTIDFSNHIIIKAKIALQNDGRKCILNLKENGVSKETVEWIVSKILFNAVDYELRSNIEEIIEEEYCNE
jgi:hypothetical protein